MLTRVLVVLLTLSASAVAQTLPSGVINTPPTGISSSESIGSNTTLNVAEGGVVGIRFNAGLADEPNMNVVVNIDGGTVGYGFVANSGSVVNILGGRLLSSPFPGIRVLARSGSEVNISGGTVGDRLTANPGSSVNISGGSVRGVFSASGSVVNFSGGSVGLVHAEPGSEVGLVGGEFRLNGAELTESTITLSDGDHFTGTLADGSTFIFSPDASDALSGVTLTPTTLPVIDVTPIVVTTPVSSGPSGLRSGQTLTLKAGGELGDNFAVIDATLHIEGGAIGRRVEVAGSLANITGGSVGEGFDAYSGSVVNISGGSVGLGFSAFSGSVANISGGSVGLGVRAFSGSEVNISGGNVGDRFDAYSGSEVNISGGTVGDGFVALAGSVVNISGGSLGDGFRASPGSEVNLVGTDFLLDGVPLDALLAGDPFTITERFRTLSGFLADGSAFTTANGRFSPNATLTVTLVPEPSSLAYLAVGPLMLTGRRAGFSPA